MTVFPGISWTTCGTSPLVAFAAAMNCALNTKRAHSAEHSLAVSVMKACWPGGACCAGGGSCVQVSLVRRLCALALVQDSMTLSAPKFPSAVWSSLFKDAVSLNFILKHALGHRAETSASAHVVLVNRFWLSPGSQEAITLFASNESIKVFRAAFVGFRAAALIAELNTFPHSVLQTVSMAEILQVATVKSFFVTASAQVVGAVNPGAATIVAIAFCNAVSVESFIAFVNSA